MPRSQEAKEASKSKTPNKFQNKNPKKHQLLRCSFTGGVGAFLLEFICHLLFEYYLVSWCLGILVLKKAIV